MPRGRALAYAAAAAALALGGCGASTRTSIPSWGELRTRANAAYGHDDAAYRDAVARMFAASGSATLLLRLARADAKLGRTDDALDELRRYAAAGMVEPLGEDPRYASLRADPRLAAVEGTMRENAAPVRSATPAVPLPHEDLLTEDIAYDPASHGFFVSSVHARKILSVDEHGAARDFLSGEPFVGLALHAGRLYATLAELPPTGGFVPAAAHPTALVAFDLASRERVLRVDLAVPGEHALTDVAVSADGFVVASDALGGNAYALAPGSARLEPIAPEGTFSSPQTPAFAGDVVLVPDYVRGIAVFDRASRALGWLAHPPDVALDGVDGLYVAGDTLYAVQNGASPPRVVRFSLDLPGRRVTACRVLERGTPGLGEPTHGAVVDGAFWFIANAGWPRYDDDGHLKKDAPPDAPAIWRIPAGS